MKTIKERPIIFNTEMVKAILDGRKTMTRRVIKPQPMTPKWTGSEWVDAGNDDTLHFALKCPYGKIGDRLWVRETWATEKYCDNEKPSELHGIETVWFLSDGDYNGIGSHTQGKTRPSIFMPRWASRINLEITDIRVERVQDISHNDAIAEGYKDNIEPNDYGTGSRARDWFAELWDPINAKRGYGWEVNPWVWVIEFKVIKKEV